MARTEHPAVERAVAAAAAHPALRVLVLIGSRAADVARSESDWDFGFLADLGLDPAALTADLAGALGTDAVDLVDLSHASAILRRDAAAHGRLLAEREPGEYENFQVEAISFWADVEPVVRQAHADVLRAAASRPAVAAQVG